MTLRYQVVARVNGYLIAAFTTETAAKDYARWRNDGRRTWRVIDTENP